MSNNVEHNVWDRIDEQRIIAVVVVDDAASAASAVAALADGGVHAIELALRTPAALEALRRVRAASPGVLLGAGTVLTPQQVHQCRDAGVDFAVAPGFNRRVVAEAMEAGLPFAPGIATPSDIEAAVELGCRYLKFFPAEPIGGLRYLTSMAAPYRHLNLRYIPLGGIDAANCAAYFACPLIAAVGGSWLAPTQLIRAGDWDEVRRRAAAVRDVIEASTGSAV